jgi:hypothetical protein
MRTYRVILGTVMLATVLGSSTAVAMAPASCTQLLTVELTPDVPNPHDSEFVSSLLGNSVSSHLTLRGEQRSSSAIVVELTGPGPDQSCRNVVDAMRNDGRVLSVHVQDE